jgi:hypothetical protein
MYNTSKKGVTMRKQLKVSLLLLSAASLLQAEDCDNSSHTFLWIRPPFQSHMPEKEAMWRDRALARDCGISGAIQAVPFGGQTTQGKDIGKYFMFCNKNCLVVAEGNAFGGALVPGAGNYNPNLRDVNAANFNIHTTGANFESTICFSPRQSFAGVGIDYKQYLHRRDACEKRWWFEVSSPIEWVRNDVRLTESISNPGTVAAGAQGKVNTSMKEAFLGQKPFLNNITQPSAVGFLVTGSVWNFGKIAGSRTHTAAAEIEVKIGYDYLCEEMCHAEGYIGGLIPTGNRPKGEFVFEPIVGNNFHGGLMWGASWGWEIWCSCDRYLHFEMATNGRYLFQNTQTRSFDVKNKPWSRYQLVYRNATEAAAQVVQEGINVFTQKVKVRPRYQKDLNTALVYSHCGFQGEIGYNFWAKTSEKVSLNTPWVPGPAFANINAAGFSTDISEINRAITIKEIFDGTGATIAYSNNARIQEQDLDLGSAATPCAISNIFYGSLGYRWDNWCWPVFVGVGGSYELASSCSAVNRFTVWGKFGVSL